MKSNAFVTLLVLGLVAMMTAAVVPAQAGGDKITICHFPPGNPENVQTIEISESAWGSHEAHGDHKGACTPDDYPPTETPTPEPTDEVTPEPTDEVTPEPTDEVTPEPTDEVTPEPTDEVTPEPTDEVTPEPTDEVTPTPEETDVPNPTSTPVPTNVVVVEEPARPALLQITVWPDNTNGQTASVTGFTWTVNGEEIYVDVNGNGVRDNGELPVVTNVEYRNRPVCEGGVAVDGQVMSRLVLGITLEDIPNGDLQSFLSGFTAYINGEPVLNGWYDIGGEFAPCSDDYGFSLTGAVQQRLNGEIIVRQP